MPDKKDGVFIKYPMVTFLCLVGILGLFWFLSGGLQEILDGSNRNMDSLSALFSGLAFAGVIVSLFLQREDIKLQRKELRQQAVELAGQKEELARQRKLAERNEFDRFYMFLFKKIDSIPTVISLAKILSRTLKVYHKESYSVTDLKDDRIFDTTLIKYKLNENKKFFEYFRLLYDYIRKSNLDIDKQQYINILLHNLDNDKKL